MNSSEDLLTVNTTTFNRAEVISSFVEGTQNKSIKFKAEQISTISLDKDKLMFTLGLVYFVSLVYFSILLFM